MEIVLDIEIYIFSSCMRCHLWRISYESYSHPVSTLSPPSSFQDQLVPFNEAFDRSSDEGDLKRPWGAAVEITKPSTNWASSHLPGHQAGRTRIRVENNIYHRGERKFEKRNEENYLRVGTFLWLV